MNKINLNIKKDNGKVSHGSLWKDNDEAFYILGQIKSGKYACIGLDDGNRWGDPANTIEAATDGLTFVAHEFEMTIDIK